MAPVLLLILFLSIFIILALIHRWLQKGYLGVSEKYSYYEGMESNIENYEHYEITVATKIQEYYKNLRNNNDNKTLTDDKFKNKIYDELKKDNNQKVNIDDFITSILDIFQDDTTITGTNISNFLKQIFDLPLGTRLNRNSFKRLIGSLEHILERNKERYN
jgi:hypothetical protein